MKKSKHIIALAALGLSLGATSCQDMLETASDRQAFDPALDQKTDSMFYTLGILKGMQQAADQYFLVNEMRGDLVATTQYTETPLRELANFSATTANKYDSAYVYYRVINNCNYYIAHRDTSLRTGSTLVAMPEYVQAHSIRAWAYLQLVKTYGRVPFYTEPLTSISDANKDYGQVGISELCEKLAPELARYSGYRLPTYGERVSAGQTSRGETKYVDYAKTMIPVDVILGDLYLESGNYLEAAKAYFNYLKTSKLTAANYRVALFDHFGKVATKVPTSAVAYASGDLWNTIFSIDAPKDIVTYIPMAVNSMRGTVSNLPAIFGYDFYGTAGSQNNFGGGYFLERQIMPSQQLYDLSAANHYYYGLGTGEEQVYEESTVSDLRLWESMTTVHAMDSTFDAIKKLNSANVVVYRGTTVFLRLAEALNRLGYPDAAFAILKDGIDQEIAGMAYVRPETVEFLTTTLPFLSEENENLFTSANGIHSHGAGFVGGEKSPYQMDTIVGNKIKELVQLHGITPTGTMADTINAVEDLICDEYALEFAFEGCRFGDLTRIARHKNSAGLYFDNFGGEWLARKLAFKNPVVDLRDENNWYLPFK